MIVFLIITILVISVLIIRLNLVLTQEKKVFRKRMKAIDKEILEINNKQKSLQNQLKISDDFDEKFKSDKGVLYESITGFNRELLEFLKKNNLSIK